MPYARIQNKLVIQACPFPMSAKSQSKSQQSSPVDGAENDHRDATQARSDDTGARAGSSGTKGSGSDTSGSATRKIADVQGRSDDRHIAINWVGIQDVRHPVTIRDRGDSEQHTVATVGMYVGLPADRKGTHMSRFLEMLNERDLDLSTNAFRNLLREMIERLDATSGKVEFSFPFFVNKAAPVTGVKSLCDYEVTLRGEIENGVVDTRVEVVVPCTSLCPCSKEISDYGAHNQRSHITVVAKTEGILWIEELIEMIESEASSEVFGVLKRADEKFVTERAYDNPKFVEDIVRDVAGRLNADERIQAYTVTCENFESIHNHSAWAQITGPA